MSTPFIVKDKLGSSAVRLEGIPLFSIGFKSSKHWAKSMLPTIWGANLAFSIADVMETAWKFPPCCDLWPALSIRGLSLVEFSSMVTCSYASKISSI